jgi:hypothetical protein
MYGDFPAENTVNTPYLPMVLANPTYVGQAHAGGGNGAPFTSFLKTRRYVINT